SEGDCLANASRLARHRRCRSALLNAMPCDYRRYVTGARGTASAGALPTPRRTDLHAQDPKPPSYDRAGRRATKHQLPPKQGWRDGKKVGGNGGRIGTVASS